MALLEVAWKWRKVASRFFSHLFNDIFCSSRKLYMNGHRKRMAQIIVVPGKIAQAFFIVCCIIFYSSLAGAHRSGCHRWHSCPPDRGNYVCGDLGYCSKCPDNQLCQGGSPQGAQKKSSASSKGQQPISQATLSKVQERLKELRYNPGSVDGKLGLKTKEAIRRFQADNQLPVTGEFNQETAKTLGIVLD